MPVAQLDGFLAGRLLCRETNACELTAIDERRPLCRDRRIASSQFLCEATAEQTK